MLTCVSNVVVLCGAGGVLYGALSMTRTSLVSSGACLCGRRRAAGFAVLVSGSIEPFQCDHITNRSC